MACSGGSLKNGGSPSTISITIIPANNYKNSIQYHSGTKFLDFTDNDDVIIDQSCVCSMPECVICPHSYQVILRDILKVRAIIFKAYLKLLKKVFKDPSNKIILYVVQLKCYVFLHSLQNSWYKMMYNILVLGFRQEDIWW